MALINYGTTTFYGNGNLKLWETCLIYNAPSGVIQVTGGTLEAAQNDQSGYLSEIRNFGQFLVNTGATAKLSLNVRNLGYLGINGQAFVQSGFFTQESSAAISNIMSGSSLTLSNPGIVLGGTLKGLFHHPAFYMGVRGINTCA